MKLTRVAGLGLSHNTSHTQHASLRVALLVICNRKRKAFSKSSGRAAATIVRGPVSCLVGRCMTATVQGKGECLGTLQMFVLFSLYEGPAAYGGFQLHLPKWMS